MPGLNRRGPEGKGAKTGRGMGYCTPERNTGESGPNDSTESEPVRRGHGRGRKSGENRGSGRGRGAR